MRGNSGGPLRRRDGSSLTYPSLLLQPLSLGTIESETAVEIIDRHPWHIRSAVIERRAEESQQMAAHRRDVQGLDRHRAALRWPGTGGERSGRNSGTLRSARGLSVPFRSPIASAAELFDARTIPISSAFS